MIAVLPAGSRLRVRRARRRGARLVREQVHAAATQMRRVPVPDPVRRHLVTPLVWESSTTTVPIDSLLLGGQNGLDGHDYAQATGDLLWTSRRVADGPHVALLRSVAAGRSSDHDLLSSEFAAMARRCIDVSGSYVGATGDAGILRIARGFVDPAGREALDDPAVTAPGVPVLAVPIQDSDCFQVVDGHHRLARMVVAGETEAAVRLRRRPVTTALQDRLDAMSWIGGERELYQPVEAPELEQSWATVRRCTDRLDKMHAQLTSLGIGRADYLDVASCYGWFLAAMSQVGHEVRGVERDPLAPTLGAAVYGLDPSCVTTADAVDFLRDQPRTYDVVSCFSLLHHFALGRASVSAECLVRLLDDVTGRVLFLDTGQAHEAWFADSLPEWDTDHVRDFLVRHTSFDRVIDLGPDDDAVAPYSHNYGRHLFACVRDT